MTGRSAGRPRRPQRVTKEQLRAMTPEAIFNGMKDGTLALPLLQDVEGLPVLPPGYFYTDLAGAKLSFRQFQAVNGELKPDDRWEPEDVVAWFMDEDLGGGA